MMIRMRGRILDSYLPNGDKMQKKTTTLIYGTGNAGKLDLMRHYLSTLQEIRLLGLKDLPFCWGEIEECGKDPLENARQKALAYYRICGQPVFSQDSGLYIEGLPKERQPGVHVRRVNGVNLTDEQMRKYYKKIAAELGGRCVAQYQNAICLVFSENEIYEARGGTLNWKKFWLMTEERPQRMEGFPLDAICADYRTGRHFYDGEATMPEEEGDGVRDFFRNALKQHEMRMGKWI